MIIDKIKILLINIIIFILLYVILEILSGDLIFNSKLNCSYINCNANYNYKSSLYSDHPIKINYKRDQYGFRGRFKPIDNLDIVVLGGSTTDERYLNLEDTWTENLEYLFKSKGVNIDIVNAGIDGQSTIGHVWNFENWFNKLNNLRVKYFFYYIGINENVKHDLQFEKEQGLKQKIKLIVQKNNGITSRLYKFFFLENFVLDELNVGHKKRLPVYYEINNSNHGYNKDYESQLISRLDNLVSLSLSFKSKPLFITQRTLRWKKEDDRIFSIDSINYYEREKFISDIIIKFCNNKNIFCIDGFNNFDLNIEDTYDLIHLSTKGSLKLSKKIFYYISNLDFTN
jgi:hypothetical protein